MDLLMQASDFDIDAKTIEQAAEAMYRTHPLIVRSGADEWENLTSTGRENWAGMVRAALAVLTPAIETALLRQIMGIADSQGFWVEPCNMSLYDLLADYLPATKEGGAPCSKP